MFVKSFSKVHCKDTSVSNMSISSVKCPLHIIKIDFCVQTRIFLLKSNLFTEKSVFT